MNMNPASVVAVAELLARLVELLGSSTESRETVLSVGPLQLDLLMRTARRGERTIDLRPREFPLIEYMMRRQGQVLTRAMLFREVWNYKFIPRTNLIDVHMGRLRRKVDEPHELPMIHNVRGAGFILRAPADAQADLARAARLATMGELTTLIAHEVSQPLMAIVTNADTCLSWLTNANPKLDGARQAAERVVRNGHRAGSIVKSIRALARKSEPEMAQFDINDAIGEILVLLRSELRRQSVLLE